MEHTNEFLQGMFAAYGGCKIQHTNISGYSKIIKAMGFYGTSLICGIYQTQVHSSNYNLETVDIARCKPILTPLSEITDEDAVEVGRIIGVIDKNCPIEDLSYWAGYTRKVYLNKHKYGSDRAYHVIDYLRSKKYDCGYLHISSLIEAGLAIKDTK